MGAAISFSNVSFGYSDKDVLSEATFAINLSEKVSIIGANGAGKSTTLKLAAGLLRPRGGSVQVLGMSPDTREVKGHIGYLPEDATPYLLLSVQENIEYSAVLRGVKEVSEATEEMLELFDLTHYRLAKAQSLSRGNLQRLSLAIMFVHKPDVLIMDEPLNYLDLSMQETLVEIIKKSNSTVFLSTHVVSTAARLTDKVMLLSNGRVTWKGELSEVESQLQKGETIEAKLAKMLR